MCFLFKINGSTIDLTFFLPFFWGRSGQWKLMHLSFHSIHAFFFGSNKRTELYYFILSVFRFTFLSRLYPKRAFQRIPYFISTFFSFWWMKPLHYCIQSQLVIDRFRAMILQLLRVKILCPLFVFFAQPLH